MRLVSASGDAAEERKRLPSVAERLALFIGRLKGLPADLSANHDHDLYRTPKRQ